MYNVVYCVLMNVYVLYYIFLNYLENNVYL